MQIYQESGLPGFWQGLLPGMLLVVNPAVNFMLYEWLAASTVRVKKRSRRSPAARRHHGANEKMMRQPKLTAAEVFLLGALSKIGATIVTVRIDVFQY